MSPSTPLPDRCDNWGRALRGTCTAGHSGSLEGAYRAPRGAEVDWEIASPPQARPAIDIHDARIIESGVRILPIYFGALLRCWHVRLWSEPKCLRVAALAAGEKMGKVRAWPQTLQMAYGLLADALELPAVIRRDRAHTITVQTIVRCVDIMRD